MVYKRYIKRDGRVSGPYYYKSYRDENGKVVSKYIGKKPPRREFLNIFNLKIFFVLILLLLVSFVAINYIKTSEKIDFVGDAINYNCVSEFEYSEWGECNAVYNLSSIFDEEIFLKGVRKRLVSDKNDCEFDKIDREECDTKRSIITKKIKKCGKDYLEVYDENEVLMFRMDLVEEGYKKLDIQVLFDGQEYCPYCYDGIKNFGENEVDCVYSGDNCPICLSEQSSLKWYFLINFLLFGAIIVCLLLFLWYLSMVKKTRKRRNEILGLALLDENKVDSKLDLFEKSDDDYELPEIPDKRVDPDKQADKLKKERLNELRWVQIAVKRNLNKEQVKSALAGLDKTKKQMMLEDYNSLMSKKTKQEQAIEIVWLKKAIKKGLSKEQVSTLLKEIDIKRRKEILKNYDKINKLEIEKQIKETQNKGEESWDKLSLKLKTTNLLNELDMILEKQRQEQTQE